jgi:hypothetical protein
MLLRLIDRVLRQRPADAAPAKRNDHSHVNPPPIAQVAPPVPAQRHSPDDRPGCPSTATYTRDTCAAPVARGKSIRQARRSFAAAARMTTGDSCDRMFEMIPNTAAVVLSAAHLM